MNDADRADLNAAFSILHVGANPSGSRTISITIPSASRTPTATVDAEPELETGCRVSRRLGCDFGVHEKRKRLPIGAIIGIVIGVIALILLARFLAKHFAKKDVARDMENAGVDATEEQKEAWRKEREGNGIRAKMLRRNDEILRKRYEQEERAEREMLGRAGVGEEVVMGRRAEMVMLRAERAAAERVGVEGTDTAALAERQWVLNEQRREEERERERLWEIARAEEAESVAEARRAAMAVEEAVSVAEARRRAAIAVEYVPPPPYAPK